MGSLVTESGYAHGRRFINPFTAIMSPDGVLLEVVLARL